MEKDSKDLLELYINSLKEYVITNSIDIDVYEDIKVRIEEKLHNILSIKSLISKEDVEQIIKQLGKPEEIFSSEWQKKSFSFPKFSKLYRDSKNWKILWVCYGLAKANDLEALRVRLAFIFVWLFFPASTIIVYIILAILLPDRVDVVNNLFEKDNSIDGVIQRLFNAMKRLFQKVIEALK